LFVAVVIFHVIVCIALIIVVLMQSSKGDGLAGTAFSGGISGAVFGGRGAAGFLSRATTVLAIVFMVNCGALAFMSSHTNQQVTGTQTTGESAITRQAQEAMKEAQARQDAAAARQAQDSTIQNPVQVEFADPDSVK
jgi:preprotein translocase subunit SecG